MNASDHDRNFDEIHAAATKDGEILDDLERRIRALGTDGELIFWLSDDDSIVVDLGGGGDARPEQWEAPTLRELLSELMEMEGDPASGSLKLSPEARAQTEKGKRNE